MTTDPTPAIEVWARMLCAADVHVYGDEHPTWQQLGRLSGKLQDDYRKAARWLLPRLTAGQPVPVDRELITVDAFARALHDAQVWFHKGDFPAWDELSTAPGRGQDEVRMVARWLLKRLFVAERAAKEADGAQQAGDAVDHRLDLSEALGLGTGAPWDAIRDRAAELQAAAAPADPARECPQCGDAGACNGGLCPLLPPADRLAELEAGEGQG